MRSSRVTARNQELIDDLNEFLEESKADASQRHDIWDKTWKYYNGEVAATVTESWTADELVQVNLLKSTINTVSPIIGDALPTWYVRSYDPANDDNADKLTQFMQGIWFDERLDRAYALARKDALVCGTGAMKVYLNTTNQRGALPSAPEGTAGRVDVAYCDPYTLYPDPNAQSLEDCRYLNIRCTMPESMVLRLYPNADTARMEPELQADRHGQWYEDTRDTGEEKRFDVWETYYDFGDKLAVWSGNEILWQGDSPVPNGRFPVVLFLDDERGTDMWGGGMIYNGGDELQTAVNRIMWRIMVHARLCVNPRFVKKGMGNVPNWSNKPGAVINLNSINSEIVPLEMPQLPPYIFSLLEMLLALWDNMTGVHDVTQGQRPQGVQSGAAIMKLQEAAQTRIRQTIREWSLQLGEVGQLVLDLMQAYYTGVQAVFQMKANGPERVSINADEVLKDPWGGPIPYRVIVQPQSDLPMSQTAWAELVMQLAAIPWPDPALMEMVFSLLRIPGRQEYFATRKQQALDMVQAAREQELEAGMAGMENQTMAASPEPMAPDTQNMDQMAMMAAMAQAGGGEPPPAGMGSEPPPAGMGSEFG